MLSVQRVLLATGQYSSGFICKKTTITRRALGACDRVADRNYGQWVPEKLLINEKDVEKYKIDPRVKALRWKIIYSDYIEEKTLKFGMKKNIAMIKQLKYKVRDKRNKDLIESPAISVALKYLREGKDASGENVKQPESSIKEDKGFLEGEESTEGSESKPIHMPYASTDRYKEVENLESQEHMEIPELNQEYLDLYEKYLNEREKNPVADNFTRIIDERKDPASENLSTRPSESMASVPPDWMTSYEQYNEPHDQESSKTSYGTPNPNIPISTIPCGGCGALLHCQDPEIPGYLPSELFVNKRNEILRSSNCQRCHFMKYYKTTLNVTVSPDEYPALLSHIKNKKIAVILMVDLTDFPCSIWSGIGDIIGKTTRVFVVGNKVDLLPNDGPNFLKNVESSLVKALNDAGVGKTNIKSVDLISAKTGYGVEKLINTLHKIWGYQGDVYLVGCTNVGKSSLFNALLRSDYCKIQATDLIQRATISPWPGTTLNLLKFPILSPVRWRLWMRTQRLIAEREGLSEDLEYRTQMFKDTKSLKYATLQGHIGRTFTSTLRTEGKGYFGKIVPVGVNPSGYMGLNEKNRIYENSRWCYDTPGAILPDQILHFLTTQELMLTLPRQMISPRSFLLYNSQTLFIAGLGRLDFLTGSRFIICTVFACSKLPVTICETEDADEVYKKLLETEAFVVPINDPERLKVFPALESKKFELIGDGLGASTSDIVLSSSGWIGLTVKERKTIEIEAWTPQGKGIHLRTPAMLSRSVKFRGYRIPASQAYTRGKRIYVTK